MLMYCVQILGYGYVLDIDLTQIQYNTNMIKLERPKNVTSTARRPLNTDIDMFCVTVINKLDSTF